VRNLLSASSPVTLLAMYLTNNLAKQPATNLVWFHQREDLLDRKVAALRAIIDNETRDLRSRTVASRHRYLSHLYT
jgi:hypothetical protein